MSDPATPGPPRNEQTADESSARSAPAARRPQVPDGIDAGGSARRTDLVAGLIGAGVYLLLIAVAIVVAPLLPASAEGVVGVYQRTTIRSDSGYDLSFVAPQGWYLTGETNTDATDADEPSSGTSTPNVASFASPDGLAAIVVTGYDAEPDPDSVLFLHTCPPAPAPGGESCVDIQLIAATAVEESRLAGADAAARALARSLGVVS